MELELKQLAPEAKFPDMRAKQQIGDTEKVSFDGTLKPALYKQLPLRRDTGISKTYD